MLPVTDDVRDTLVVSLSRYGELLYVAVEDQVQIQVREAELLVGLATSFAADGFYLVTAVANDERELEDRRFKIYYMFSHPSVDLFVTVEYLLDRGSSTYPSLHAQFPAVDCFEREMLDMLGLRPQGPRRADVRPGSWLHESYPDDLHPLRRTSTADALRQVVETHASVTGRPPPPPPATDPDAVTLTLPVGPIHAGVVESGQFLFTVAGEVVEDLDIRLGYAHRGVERLFQSRLHLLEGWWLAEQVSGDSSVAHSLAYCRAAETLTDARVPRAADLLRAVFLELERIHNHVADVAALADDVALSRLGSELAVVREQLLRLNHQLTGERYLRRVNRVGGVALPSPPDAATLRTTLGASLDRFDKLVGILKGHAGFRSRTIGIGVLTTEHARRLGVTGLTARASGVARDSRWDHPAWVYGDAGLRAGRTPSAATDEGELRAGDVYARFLARVEEVGESRAIIAALLRRWEALPLNDRTTLLAEPRVLPDNNYTSVVGYAEGFRGDVVYWLMQDKMNGIYRCKVRDPSMLNWPALRQCVLPQTVGSQRVETMLADFPLVNRSFNLSYAGNDL